MKSIQVALCLIALVGYVLATGYGSGGGGGGYGGGSSGSGAGGAGYGGGASGSAPSFRRDSSSSGQSGPPQPYSFEYTATDEQGNVHYRNEQGDQNGNVKGTYGYNDAQGLYRIVEYVADENGFRPVIKTNEPGVDGKESPADVVLTAEQPPSGLQGSGSSAQAYKPSGSGAPSGFPSSFGGGAPKSGSGKSGY